MRRLPIPTIGRRNKGDALKADTPPSPPVVTSSNRKPSKSNSNSEKIGTPPSSTSRSRQVVNQQDGSNDTSFEQWQKTANSNNSHTTTSRSVDVFESDDEDDKNYHEPKHEISMGLRRGGGGAGAVGSIDKIASKMKELHVKNNDSSAAVKLSATKRKKSEKKMYDIANDSIITESSAKVHVGKKKKKSSTSIAQQKLSQLQQGGNNGGTSSISGQHMANIHSSPLSPEFDIAYIPPIYPKSEEDATFIELALQRNFVGSNALSDDENVRKRELRQVVDAFEYYSVEQSGVVILSTNTVGDYFYLLTGGSVRYYDKYTSSSSSSSSSRSSKSSREESGGGGNIIGMANRPGQSFGELCLLYDCPPPADCVSSGSNNEAEVPCPNGAACSFWRIHKLIFRQILALRTMRRDLHLRENLQRVLCLRELDVEYLRRIADAMNASNVERGTVLYTQGSVCDTFYLIGSQGKVQLSSNNKGGGGVVLGPGEGFAHEALSYGLSNELLRSNSTPSKQSSLVSSSSKKYPSTDDIPRHTSTAMTLECTVVLSMTNSHFQRVVGSLEDAILLSRDRRVLRSVPLFRDTDLEDFEYELLTALIENVHMRINKEIFVEGDNVDEPALFIVRSGAVEAISEEHPKLNRVIQCGGYFGEETLTPDENMRFGGAKGGRKFSNETVDVITDEVILGRLTLANIDSVIQDLHRLGCRRKKNYQRRKSKSSSDEEELVMSLDDLEFHRLFGTGTFGRVWIVSPFGKTAAYALKIQCKRELLDQRLASGAQRERAVMAKLDHPFVCKLVNTFQDEACIYMLMRFVQGGELLNLIQGGDVHGGVPESAAKFYAAGILEGLTHMHQRQIVYRDLKPENVLLDHDGYAVIVDFGFSKIVSDKTYTFCGTPLYIAPEIILSRGHDRGVDYWALGCLVYEMLFGLTPFYEPGIDQKSLFKRIARGKWKIPKDHNKVDRSAIEFIWGVLQRHPAERLGCLAGGYRDVKNHAWFQEVNFGKLIKKKIQAPWVPDVVDALDTSNFPNMDDEEDDDFLKGKAPLTVKEQLVFQDF